MNILTRKPRPAYAKDAEVVIVKREHPYHPFVVSTVTQQSLKYNEWHNGYYFKTLEEAVMFFTSYPENRSF